MQADADTVRDVLRGDREAFADLVARHERAVWATCWRVLRDDHAASDASQEAFLQAFRRLGGLRQPERFGVWLLQIARREAIRLARIRAQAPDRPLDGGDSDRTGTPEGPATAVPADSKELLEAVARLPEHERLVVSLRYLEGRTVAEIASALGRPVGTVTKQLSRAIERLRIRTKGVLG
ncbi:MAG: sigma-70 family RNA polymerase sigma factor [Isosphaeraceae bacterium]